MERISNSNLFYCNSIFVGVKLQEQNFIRTKEIKLRKILPLHLTLYKS